MYQMDNEKFGAFIGELRREKHLTQKELAEKLFISDKAVSKWERGLSIPNVSMLIPLAEILGVTVTELLRGERLEAAGTLNRDEVEKLVTCSVDMSMKEQGTQRRLRKQWSGIYVFTLCAAAAELIMFRGLGFTWEEMADSVLPYVGMLLLFGGWFCIFAKETLPSFYDKNKINFVSDGVFRMNMPGLHFNNSNWPYILKVGRVWNCVGAVLFPIIGYILWRCFGNEMWILTRMLVPLLVTLGMFIPMYIFGKKYE
ncbi:helix-turn-helix domain-containing protein [Frisingicoccus sp.]|uniref:helix-turn-helix domain-containing protein n=1 Tax=Frisingicoccus sp. TaxID=1918627 RepID=UPI003AB7D775